MDKVRWLRNFLGLSQKEMAEILGIKQNAYSNIETGKVSLTDRNKDILSLAFGISRSWFDKDEALMFLVKNPLTELIAPNPYGKISNDDYDPKDIRDAALKTVELYKKPIVLTDLQSGIPSQSVKETRPRVPLTAAAGSLSGDSIGVTLQQCEQMPLIHQIPSYDFTMFIKGDSMSPRFESGDEIACRHIDQSRFIQWGKVHVLDTTQGFVIKRVYEDGDRIRCVSYNPDYSDFSVPKEDILSMSLVVGVVSIMEM